MNVMMVAKRMSAINTILRPKLIFNFKAGQVTHFFNKKIVEVKLIKNLK